MIYSLSPDFGSLNEKRSSENLDFRFQTTFDAMAAAYSTDFTAFTTFSTVKPNFEQQFGRGGFAEAVDADDCAVQSDRILTSHGVSGFYGDAAGLRVGWRLDRRCLLAVEYVGGRHGHDAHGDVLRGEGLFCASKASSTGTGGNDDGLGVALGFADDEATRLMSFSCCSLRAWNFRF